MSEILANRYMIVKSIGKGGMADVYLAFDTILKREVAVKVLKGELASDPVSLERFRREAHASTCLSHPNIVDIYDIGEDEGRHFIVMEYIKGYTLKQLILKRGAIPYRESVWLMKQLALALMEAHKNGIIHRDVKSQNVLIKADGTVKMVDFGIAVAHDAMQITSKDAILGSVHYLAPELTKGAAASMQSDIYSLGIVFYELLCGDVPFKADQAVQVALKHLKEEIPSVRKCDNKIPQSVENIILKATAKSTDHRYHNVAEMIKDLNECLKEEHLNDPKITFEEAPKEVKKVSISGKAEKAKKPKKKRDVLPVIFLFLISIISVILLGVILLFSGVIGRNDKYVNVPNVAGLSVVEADDVLDDFGLSIDYSNIERVMTENIEEGKIISFTPSLDTEVEKGTKIKVVVSEGVYQIMDDYIGQNIEQVKAELILKNFNVQAKAVESDEEPGTILTQEGILEGDQYNPKVVNIVNFTYSQYPAFLIPFNTKGRYFEDVRKEFEDLGMNVKVEKISSASLSEEEKEKYDAHTVCRIEPNEGVSYIQQNDNQIVIYYYE